MLSEGDQMVFEFSIFQPYIQIPNIVALFYFHSVYFVGAFFPFPFASCMSASEEHFTIAKGSFNVKVSVASSMYESKSL